MKKEMQAMQKELMALNIKVDLLLSKQSAPSGSTSEPEPERLSITRLIGA